MKHKLIFIMLLAWLPNIALGQQGTPIPYSTLVGNVASSLAGTLSDASRITTGILPASRLPTPTGATLGGVQSAASVAHQWVSYIDTSGVPHLGQPGCGDLSNVAASCSVDTTNAANITSGAFTGLTWSGGTLSGSIAGSPTFSGTLAVTGTATLNNTNVGSNTTGKNLTLNGASGSASALQFSVANVKSHTVSMDSLNNLKWNTCDNTGANCINWLKIANTTGAPTFNVSPTFAAPKQTTPGTITVSGADIGTPGVSMLNYDLWTLNGSSSGFIFETNKMWLKDNMATPSGITHFGYHFFWDLGGPNFDGHFAGIYNQINLATDMPALTSPPAFVVDNPKVVAQNNIAQPGGMEASNPVCDVLTSTNYTSGNSGCIEIDYSLSDQASPAYGNTGLFLSINSRNRQQGHGVDSMLKLGATIPSASDGKAMTARDGILFGVTQFPVNNFNGAILTTSFQVNPNTDGTSETPIAAPLGFDLSKFASSDAVMRWPSGRLNGGEADLNFLSIKQGANGPVLDATLECVSAVSWVSGTAKVGQQWSDRFGGNLVVDTVNGSNHPTAQHFANSVPPCLGSGSVTTTARGITIAPSASGGSVLNFGEAPGFRVGDIITAAAAGIPAGDAISSITNQITITANGPNVGTTIPTSSTSTVTDGGEIEGMCIAPASTVISHVVNTSITVSTALVCSVASGIQMVQRPAAIMVSALTGTVPANTPIVAQIAGIPSNPVTLIGPASGTMTYNYTWATPTTVTFGGTAKAVIANVVTSCTGLPSGTLWNNAGTAAFCP